MNSKFTILGCGSSLGSPWITNFKGKLSKKIANILIHELGPNYNDRNGGYTRIIKMDNRKNDNPKRCLIEFVDLKNTSNSEKYEVNEKDKNKED